jgi:hypothetical protein
MALYRRYGRRSPRLPPGVQSFFFRSNWSTPQHSLKVLADFCERILDIENVRLVCRAQQTELTQDNVMRHIMSTKESQSEDLS